MIDLHLLHSGGHTLRGNRRAYNNERTPPEAALLRIYDFVVRTLALSWDSDDVKLLLLFSKCIAQSASQQFTVLNLGMSHLFSDWHATILNAAIFFEHLFTNESRKYRQGVQVWNELFGAVAHVDEKIVLTVFDYRHLGVHSNAKEAKLRIVQWKADKGFSDLQAADAVKTAIWSIAKMCLRAIINDEPRYRVFQSRRPI